ncbi:MAG: signal peptidase I [Egibacteraceae bacterium]
MDIPAVPTRALPTAAAAVAAVTLAAWLAPLVLPTGLPSAVGILGVDPLRWLAPAAVAAWLVRGHRRLLLADGTRWAPTAACVGVAQVAVLVIAGLVFGMGRSPWSHSAVGLLTIAWTTPLMLVGAEVTRAYLARTLRGPAATAVPWGLLLVVGLSLAAPTQFADPANGIRYLGEVVLPAAGAGLLATVLAQRGGAGAALAYVGPLAAFERLSPILPDLPWAVTALVGMLVPILGLHLLDTTAETERAVSRDQQRRSSDVPYLVTAILAGAIIALNTGALGVTPAVIHGISMEPTMHEGDIVLARRVASESLTVGDVVSFHQRGRTVVHRIARIDATGGSPVLTTLGDNNEAPDSPVPAETLVGRVVMHLPGVGQPILWVQRAMAAVL